MIDYVMLNRTIDESGIKRVKLAEDLKITRAAFWYKTHEVEVAGKRRDFTTSELEALKESLSLNNAQFRRIFFATERELNATSKSKEASNE